MAPKPAVCNPCLWLSPSRCTGSTTPDRVFAVPSVPRRLQARLGGLKPLLTYVLQQSASTFFPLELFAHDAVLGSFFSPLIAFVIGCMSWKSNNFLDVDCSFPFSLSSPPPQHMLTFFFFFFFCGGSQTFCILLGSKVLVGCY